ncbi:MAG: hypothetical protein ACLVMF_10930 [Christensenellales bacterium]
MSWVYFCASSLYTKQQPPKEAGSTEEALRLRFAFDKKNGASNKKLAPKCVHSTKKMPVKACGRNKRSPLS